MRYFEMPEMTKAAEVIVSLDESRYIEVSLQTFSTDEQRDGFLHLIDQGFMYPSGRCGVFIPDDTFWKRIPGR